MQAFASPSRQSLHIGYWHHPETSTTELSWVMSYVKSSRQAIFVAIFLKCSLVLCSLSEKAWARSRPIKFARLQSRPRPSTRVAQNNFFSKVLPRVAKFKRYRPRAPGYYRTWNSSLSPIFSTISKFILWSYDVPLIGCHQRYQNAVKTKTA